MQTRTALQIFSLALFWIGCDAVQPIERKKDTSSNLANNSRDLGSTAKEPVARPAAIEITPSNGDIVDGRTDGASITFSGFTTAAGQTVEVQVLSSADLAVAEANWVTLATTTSSATGTTFNDKDAIFHWEVEAVPGTAASWIQGGLLRYRTVVTGTAGVKTLLPFWDKRSGDCIEKIGKTKSWKDLLKICKSAFSPDLGAKPGSTTRAATLVSPGPTPGDNFLPNYLSRKGYIEEQETIDYYATIGAPETLTAFADRFGFNSFDLFAGDGDQADALYYNNGDLAIGREIHCRTFVEDGEEGTACITRNYGALADGTPDFSGDADAAMRDAVDNVNSFAAVCMVKFGKKFNGAPNDVQFIVYNAAGDLANRAGLDTITSNDAIPNNCLNCHGGNFERAKSAVIGASFLPYDPEAFLFSKEPGFSYEEQQDQFRKLNVLVRNAGAPPGTAQYINGMYGDKAEVKGTKASFDWVPTGWVTPEAKTVYREVYKPYCRTCHTSQIGDFAFMTYEDFKGEASKTMNSACITNEMPVAEATMNQFWQSSARAYLINSLGTASACTAEGRQ